MNKRLQVILISLLMTLSGCKTHQPANGTAIDEMNVALGQSIKGNQQIERRYKPLPRSVSQALIPSHRFKRRLHSVHPRERRFDLSVKNVPAKTFFMGLVKGTSLSMTVSPQVAGSITLSLKNVTIAEVLQTLEDVYGYSYRQITSGYQILPNTLKTKIYAVNYLDISRKGTSNMQISSGQVSQSGGNGQNNQGGGAATAAGGGQNSQVSSSIGDVETKSSSDFWKQLKSNIESMISTEEGRAVTVNPMAGMAIVRAYPTELKQVEAYLDAVQQSMNREVILEAKILEVNLNDRHQMGIDWKIFGADLNAINDFPDGNITQGGFPNAFNVGVNWMNNFKTTIRALSEQGNVQVLSSPRVSALNNQKAVIKVGSDEFFVTNISNTNLPAGNTVAPTQEVQLTPFFSGITLDVTPQIDASGKVTLHIHPSVSRVVDQQKQVSLGSGGQLTLPLARSTIREADSVVHAMDGQVIVLGGLMQNRTEEDLAGLPPFGQVPFLGTLFRNTKQGSLKSELVILLKPTVVKRKTWSTQAVKLQQRINGVKRGFHIGSHPDVFGTEGEVPKEIGPVAGRYGTPH